MQAIIYNSHNTRPTSDRLYPEAIGSPPNTLPESAEKRTLRVRLKWAFWHVLVAVLLALCIIAVPISHAKPNDAPTVPANTLSEALPSAGAPQTSRYFAVTGKTVSGEFLATFNRYGLQSIGYPVSDERQENGQIVQYFERVRMERHPELVFKGYGVLMTRLGNELSRDLQPFAGASRKTSTKATQYFKQTNHTLSGAFLTYWKAHGGLQRFGYPISEPATEHGLYVQWFERARFEYHPEQARKGQTVQLSLLGKLAYERSLGQNVSLTALSIPVVPAPQIAPAQKPEVQLPKPAQINLSAMESYVLAKVNEQRAAAGLGPVQSDGTLVELARSRSNDMATRNYFSHTTPEGANFLGMLNSMGVPYKYAGEILARNNYSDGEAASIAMTSYLNSAPHKAIMLDGRYNFVGIGYAKSSDGMHYFTVIFAQR